MFSPPRGQPSIGPIPDSSHTVGEGGLEPLSLPAETPSDLQVHSVSFRFSPARYLRFCFRVLTASRVGINYSSPSGASPDRRVGAYTIRPNGLEVVCVVGLA